MYKICVIGGRETVIGFKALGLDTYPVDNSDEAKVTLQKISNDENNYAIIYIQENIAADIMPEINKYKDIPTPAIILIPGREGSIGIGQSALKEAVERAVGTNILGD